MVYQYVVTLLPPPPPDEEHVRLLGVFSFVLAGLGFLGLGFVWVHYLMMTSLFASNPQIMAQMQVHVPASSPFVPSRPPTVDPRQFLQFFIWIYVFIGGWSLLSVV